jgi:hypothetical protein
LLQGKYLREDTLTVSVKTLFAEGESAVETPGQEVIAPPGQAAEENRRSGHSAQATLRRRDAWRKSAATNG